MSKLLGDFLTILIIPIIMSVIVLIIEYWIIQPLRKSKNGESESDKGKIDWTKAIERAIEKFKDKQPQYHWAVGYENIKIDKVRTGRAHGILILSVITDDTFRIPFEQGSKRSRPYLLAKYSLTIDSVGHILELNLLEKAEDRGGSFSRFKSPPIWGLVILMIFFCAFSGIVGGVIYGVIVWRNGEVVNKQFLDMILDIIVQITIVSTVIGAIFGMLLGLIVRWADSL